MWFITHTCSKLQGGSSRQTMCPWEAHRAIIYWSWRLPLGNCLTPSTISNHPGTLLLATGISKGSTLFPLILALFSLPHKVNNYTCPCPCWVTRLLNHSATFDPLSSLLCSSLKAMPPLLHLTNTLLTSQLCKVLFSKCYDKRFGKTH